MENNFVTLETAKKLKAAGFPQDCQFEYWVDTVGAWQAPRPTVLKPTVRETYAAPTAQEIADQLPHFIGDYQLLTMIAYGVFGRPDTDTWQAGYFKVGNKVGKNITDGLAPTMAEALAALYLKLKENNHD
jgi:hypothetical protein